MVLPSPEALSCLNDDKHSRTEQRCTFLQNLFTDAHDFYLNLMLGDMVSCEVLK